jgi:hypothetical protein
MQVNRIQVTRADILYELTKDLGATTKMLLALRELLPGINISLLASRW